MTREQGALLELLDEVRDAARELKMRCYLIGDQLLYASRNGVMHGFFAEVAMTRAGFEKFKRRAEKTHAADREFEPVGEGGGAPALYYRYVNKNTLLYPLDYAREWKKFGIAVHIFLLVKDDSGLTGEEPLHELPPATKNALRRGAPWKGAEDGTPLLFTREGLPTRLPENFDEKTVACVLNGHEYRTFYNAEAYLTACYGEKWRTCKVDTQLENYMVFADPAVPYERFLKDPGFAKLNASFFRKRDRFLTGYRGKFQSYDEAEKKAWDYFFAAEARIRCWKKYMPLKRMILKVWDSGRHDDAMLRMKTYLDLLAEYRKKGIALCFDSELWNIYLAWLSENGREAERKKLKGLVWPEHLKPIDTPETRAWLEEREECRMGLGHLTLRGRNYVYSRSKSEGMLYRLENVLTEDRVEKTILCVGTVNNLADILPTLRALGQARSAGLDFTLLLPGRINFRREIAVHLEHMELTEHTVFLDDPAVYTKECMERIELPSEALGSVWLAKRRCLIANCADDIFERLMTQTEETLDE